ncbi:MAG: N4-gp56 family major capsid protein [Clostridia bacterium]
MDYRMKPMDAFALNLRLFDTQTTTTSAPGNDLTPEMKTYYHDRLGDNAEPNLVHDQFAQKCPIPKNGGKTIEFRRYSPLPKALNKLTEGVTPNGNKLNVTTLNATVEQYGDYIELSDILETTAIDRNVEEATKLLGSQAGRTLDTVTREVLAGGTNKLFAPKPTAGGGTTEVLLRKDVTTECGLTLGVIRKAVATLKRMNAVPINGNYVMIIHTDVSSDLFGDKEWVDVHKYTNAENIYSGEIGRLYNVRFVETTEAKIVGPGAMLGIERYYRTKLNSAAASSAVIYPEDTFTVAQAAVVTAEIAAGSVYKLYVDGVEATVASVTGGNADVCKITLETPVTAAAGAMVCGIGAGKDGSAIYCSLLLADNAYGTTEISGMGLQHIVKQLGSGGTTDPINQRSTTGWKATKVAERLVEEYMLRIEHSSAGFGAKAESN